MHQLISIEELPQVKNKILYFYSPEGFYHPKMKEILSSVEEIKCFSINIESDKSLIKRFNLKSLPTVILYSSKEIKRFTGIVSIKDLKKSINSIKARYIKSTT